MLVSLLKFLRKILKLLGAERVQGVLRGNSVGILPISSEWIGIFQLNLAAISQVSIESFWHSYTWNLKHLRKRKSKLLSNTYYLQISWHDMHLKLILGILFDKWSWSMIFKLDQVTFSENPFWSVNFAVSFCQIYCVQMSALWIV